MSRDHTTHYDGCACYHERLVAERDALKKWVEEARAALEFYAVNHPESHDGKTDWERIQGGRGAPTKKYGKRARALLAKLKEGTS